MQFDPQKYVYPSRRNAVYARRAAACTSIPQGAQIGLEIMRRGGNAVDAAVAVAYALGVSEPYTSGLGGGGFMIVHTADGENQFIDYREVASSGQTAESWLDDSGNLIENANSVGGLAVGVPGEVAGLELALSQFGSGKLSRQQIMQPAIDLANNGYVVSPTMYGAIADEYERMIGEYSELGQYYLKDGLPYEVGDIVTNPDLAKTLQLIAENGADAFYKGEVAEAIVAARKKIVEGAVGMVEMALDQLNEDQVVALDDERKAAMVSNLLVVLCGSKDAQPVVNSGSIY